MWSGAVFLQIANGKNPLQLSPCPPLPSPTCVFRGFEGDTPREPSQ